MKKPDMAQAAEQLLAGTGWLPAILRTPEPEADQPAPVEAEDAGTVEQPSEAEAPDTGAQDGEASYAVRRIAALGRGRASSPGLLSSPPKIAATPRPGAAAFIMQEENRRSPGTARL